MTPARIALGRVGSGLPTDEVLRFALAHAQARDAVHTPFDAGAVEAGHRRARLRDAACRLGGAGARSYLRRPDLGRKLSEESRAALQAPGGGPVDLALVVADGLSSTAVHVQAVPFLKAFKGWIAEAGWSLAPVVVASQARVALGDEVGELIKARAVVVLIGERPGLSSPDSLGLYLTFAPKVGRTDAERNCISNVRGEGLSHEHAAFKLAWLLRQALVRQLTGVSLKDESDLLLVEGRAPARAAERDLIRTRRHPEVLGHRPEPRRMLTPIDVALLQHPSRLAALAPQDDVVIEAARRGAVAARRRPRRRKARRQIVGLDILEPRLDAPDMARRIVELRDPVAPIDVLRPRATGLRRGAHGNGA